MSGAAKNSPRSPATTEDLLSRPEEGRYEIVDGRLVPKEAASGKHGEAQGMLFHALVPYRRRGGGTPGRPGGWLFASEALVEFAPGQVRRPDVAGWRRENLGQMPVEVPIRVRPDWICEILSPRNASEDTVKKMNLYHRCGVPHYWLLDPIGGALIVQRWTEPGYLNVLAASREQTVRAEPFDALELRIGVLLGDDEES